MAPAVGIRTQLLVGVVKDGYIEVLKNIAISRSRLPSRRLTEESSFPGRDRNRRAGAPMGGIAAHPSKKLAKKTKCIFVGWCRSSVGKIL